ncbi:MAG: protein phosphatase 2C domain-containing protein [Methanomicrobiales archaeon]|nr:protein phosphatase 2C domain-containing protein [Methanomicrobiales archaeon]
MVRRDNYIPITIIHRDMFSTPPESDLFGMSHQGGREENEDAYLILELEGGYLLAVADGLGGCPAGEVASRMAIEVLSNAVNRGYTPHLSDREVESLLRSAFLQIHESILTEAVGPRRDMGTTLVTALVTDRRVVLANTGDSRAYIIDGGVRFRTRDHSPVERLLQSGQIDGRRARNHPFRHIVEHALGIDFYVDTYIEVLKRGEILLLSSDGLHDFVEEDDFMVCTSAEDAKRVANCLMEQALRTSSDNVTIVVYRCNTS